MSPPPDDVFRGGPTGGERQSSANSSPEFEFWRARDPSAVEPPLLSADELFLDGVILPLRLLRHPAAPHRPPASTAAATVSSAAALGPSSSSSAAAAGASSSKRWRDIFRVPASEKKAGGSGGLSELNINLWPFSRSRSAGNGAGAGKDGPAGAARRVSSAPCSRSGSRRDRELSSSSSPSAGAGAGRKWAGSAPCSRSGSRREREPSSSSAAAAAARPPPLPSTGGAGRKWASSPSRQGLAGGGGGGGGVHVRRVSPVWRVRRGGKKGHGENQGSHFNLKAFFSRKLYI
ncbi:unnamed protein product [Spirodela intermedia]|uniref:Uncharacterized protein n=1 Tax=Spirodela intermedia TaxID=51605 RepID=A0A7I8L3X1_SPIIN|nr:unnamed protein product [Spirodela intermedia]